MANEATAPALYTVAAPPHWHCGRTVTGVMQQYILALLPAAVMAVVYYGLPALRVMALSCATAVAVEAACCRIMDRESSVDDFHAVLTGLLFAFLLPAAAPWWLVVVGAAVTIVMGKMLFGGLGGNPLCAPLVGWAILALSWKTQMDPDAMVLATTLVNPLTQLKYLGLAAAQKVSLGDMLLGKQLGGLGAVQVLALLAGAAFLAARGLLKLYIPLSFLAGVFLTGLVYYLMDGSVYPNPVFHLLTGSVVLGACFLATDPNSSPVNRAAMVCFGLTCGVMTVIIRVYGMYPDGVPFAILLANLFTPMFDLIRPKPFGAR
ncbi:MAG: RnfABCDGE type electron transport complex subunit D [Thermodesulfobacteriota bacterium]